MTNFNSQSDITIESYGSLPGMPAWHMNVYNGANFDLPGFYDSALPDSHPYREQLVHTRLYDIETGQLAISPNAIHVESPLKVIRDGIYRFLTSRGHSDDQALAVRLILNEMSTNILTPRLETDRTKQIHGYGRMLVLLSIPQDPSDKTSYIGIAENIMDPKLLERIVNPPEREPSIELTDSFDSHNAADFNRVKSYERGLELIDGQSNEYGIGRERYYRNNTPSVANTLADILRIPTQTTEPVAA